MARKILGWNTGKVKEELFPQHYRFSFEKQLSYTETKQYYPYVAATAFVHGCKDRSIPKGWRNLSPKELGLSMPDVDMEDKWLFDRQESLKISLLEKDAEIIVAFGSLEAESIDRTKARHPRRDKLTSIAQSIFGFNPKTFNALDRIIPVLLMHERFQNKRIVFTGNSFGGTLAQYAGLKFEREAVCCNAVGLNCGTQYYLGAKKLRQADKYVTHISVKGDYVTDLPVYKPLDLFLSGIGIRTPGNFGRRFTIPSAYSTYPAIHGFILGSVMEYLGHGCRAYPADIDV